MTLLAQRFPDDAERGVAMGRTMGGIWFGGTGNKSFRWSDTKNSRI